MVGGEQAEKAAHRKRVKELEGDPAGLLLFALEKLTGKKAADAPSRPMPQIPPQPHPNLPRLPEKKQKVGRNDPRPCGSGKKYKKCCGRLSS